MATKIRRGTLARVALLEPQRAKLCTALMIAREVERRLPNAPKPDAERTHFSVRSPLIERRVRSFVNRRRNK